MTVTVLLPSVLRAEAGGAAQLDIAANGTLADVVREIADRWPRLERRICDERGEIRRFVNVYVAGEDVRRLEGLATPVPPGTEVQILPSIAGGQG
jgi:molybdopterin converting factor small subunit